MTTTERSGPVLDASALLALALEEPGSAEVITALRSGAVNGAVNYAEVLTRLGERAQSVKQSEAELLRITGSSFRVETYLEKDAVQAAELRRISKHRGLSLGDRSCLALAARLGAAVLTADRAWVDIAGLAVPVTLIR
jgi:ribonuclease VapC